MDSAQESVKETFMINWSLVSRWCIILWEEELATHFSWIMPFLREVVLQEVSPLMILELEESTLLQMEYECRPQSEELRPRQRMSQEEMGVDTPRGLRVKGGSNVIKLAVRECSSLERMSRDTWSFIQESETFPVHFANRDSGGKITWFAMQRRAIIETREPLPWMPMLHHLHHLFITNSSCLLSLPLLIKEVSLDRILCRWETLLSLIISQARMAIRPVVQRLLQVLLIITQSWYCQEPMDQTAVTIIVLFIRESVMLISLLLQWWLIITTFITNNRQINCITLWPTVKQSSHTTQLLNFLMPWSKQRQELLQVLLTSRFLLHRLLRLCRTLWCRIRLSRVLRDHYTRLQSVLRPSLSMQCMACLLGHPNCLQSCVENMLVILLQLPWVSLTQRTRNSLISAKLFSNSSVTTNQWQTNPVHHPCIHYHHTLRLQPTSYHMKIQTTSSFHTKHELL